MVFSDPRFVESQAVQQLDRFKVSLERKCRIFAGLVVGGVEAAKAQMIHGSSVPVGERETTGTIAAASNRTGSFRKMTYVITEPCIGTKDTSCADVCPVDCIHPAPGEEGHETASILYIDPNECIDCDACVEACPVDATMSEDDVPSQWESFKEINRIYYDEGQEAAEKAIKDFLALKDA